MTRLPERSLGWPGRVALGALVVLAAVLATTDWITLILYGSYAVVAAVLIVVAAEERHRLDPAGQRLVVAGHIRGAVRRRGRRDDPGRPGIVA